MVSPLPVIHKPSMASSSSPKPKPPLTAYNLFFQLERKRILEEKDGFSVPITSQSIRLASKERKMRGKRPHRKSHGKISFRELAKTVANRWKELDQETKDLLESEAIIEKEEFENEYKAWIIGSDTETSVSNNHSIKGLPPSRDGASHQPIPTFSANGKDERSLILDALHELQDRLEAEISRLRSVTLDEMSWSKPVSADAHLCNRRSSGHPLCTGNIHNAHDEPQLQQLSASFPPFTRNIERYEQYSDAVLSTSEVWDGRSSHAIAESKHFNVIDDSRGNIGLCYDQFDPIPLNDGNFCQLLGWKNLSLEGFDMLTPLAESSWDDAEGMVPM